MYQVLQKWGKMGRSGEKWGKVGKSGEKWGKDHNIKPEMHPVETTVLM
jgi:hypothetical protein